MEAPLKIIAACLAVVFSIAMTTPTVFAQERITVNTGLIATDLSEDGPGVYAGVDIVTDKIGYSVGVRDYRTLGYRIQNASVEHDYSTLTLGLFGDMTLGNNILFRPELGAEVALSNVTNVSTDERNWGYYAQLGLAFPITSALDIHTFIGANSGPSHVKENWYAGLGISWRLRGYSAGSAYKLHKTPSKVATREPSPPLRRLPSRTTSDENPVLTDEKKSVAQPSTTAPEPDKPQFKYAVQVGAFRELTNASKILSGASTQQIPVFHIYTDGLYRIFVKPSTTRSEVMKSKKMLATLFPKAFVKSISTSLTPL